MNDKQTKVLIVENEAPLKAALEEKFTEAGHVVIAASDGERGLHLALTELPDAIILDIKMPNVDGLEMLRRFRDREDKDAKSPYILILTNLSGINEAAEAITLGAYHYVVKSDHSLDEIVKQVSDNI